MRYISLQYMPPQIMLIMEYPSRVRYENQVAGPMRIPRSLEGILIPLVLESEATSCIQNSSYPPGAQGITITMAETIDKLLASERFLEFLRIDHSRLHESCEAWVYVTIDAPDLASKTYGLQPSDGYLGSIYGFKNTRGVMTWRSQARGA